MITRLQLLRSVGVFASVDAGANFRLARLTLVYAENGRGKTTLAAILRSLATGDPIQIAERRRLAAQHPPHIVLECDNGQQAVFQDNAWNRAVPNMVVFDDLFVDQNVCSGLAVDPAHRHNLHELILGAEGVALNRTLQEKVVRIEEHNRALRTNADGIPASERGAMSVDDFCALQARSDIDEAIQAAERNLAAARDQEAIRNASPFDSLSLPVFDVDGINRLLQQDLANLDTTAAERVQRHFTTLGHGGEEWVSDGFRRMQAPPGADTQTCPFCAQTLTGSPVINHYRAYFSEGYANLKRTITETAEAVDREHAGDAPAEFERAVRVWGERRQFWSRFCDVPEVAIDTAEIARTWSAAREAVATPLRAKHAAPLERMSLSDSARAAIDAFEAHRQGIAGLNERLQQANRAIRLVKERAAAGNPTALAAEVARLKATKARHTPPTASLCTDYLNEKAAKATTERQREEAKRALRRHRSTIFPAFQTAINQYLQRFYAGFRLARVEARDTGSGPTCNYNVVINDRAVPIAGGTTPPGEPSFRTTLSSGDRNTLALAFFFASLDQDPALGQRIIVIDDPITSLDDHRSLTTVQEARMLATRAQQVIVLSHDKRFLCRVWENADRRECVALAVVRDADGSTLQRWNVNDDCLTEYDRQHERLRNYVGANTGNSRQVAQDIRHVLEGFLRRACAEHFLPGEVLGNLRGRIRNRQLTDPEILPTATVTELDAISEYANRFHHDTNPAWETEAINDAELRGWVERTLQFVRK